MTAARPIENRSVDPGRAVAWWAEAWALFRRDVLRWVVLGLLLMLGFGLLGYVPWLGALATALLTPVLMGGWVLAAHKVQGGGGLELRDVLGGFRSPHLRPLLALGAGLAGTTLLVMVANVLLGVAAVLGPVGIVEAPHGAAAPAVEGVGMLALLLLLAFSLLVTAALWFAPALVVLRGAAAGEAAIASLRAVRDNGLTFLIYGLVQLLLLAVVATLPYQVGWVVLLPVMVLTGYVSYCEVFGE